MKTLFLFCQIALLFSLVSFVPHSAQALSDQEIIQKVLELRAHESNIWLRLLQYSRKTNESAIDGPSFFLSPDGKNNPEAELISSLQMLLEQKTILDEPQLFQCRFPARTDFLIETIKSLGVEIPRLPCPRFQRWYETVRGESVSIVFSSYFLNNPSSAYGHTFLRVNKVKGGPAVDRYELLDYGFNYAANGAANDNALVYSLKGLFGGYPGTFTTTPYYYKVREYSNAESRDLWDYELNFSQSGVIRLVKHIWELGPTSADYWYLTENCSYFILKLLEVADPEKDLVGKVKMYVVPKETIVALFKYPDFVNMIRYRPSTRSTLLERMTLLNSHQQDLLNTSIRNLEWNPKLEIADEEKMAHVLDAAIDEMDFKYSVAVQKPDSKETLYKNQLLKKRSHLSYISKPMVVPTPTNEAPHLGHGVRRMGVGFLSGPYGKSAVFSYKFSLHDLLEPEAGYPPSAQLTFFNFVGIIEDDKLNLKELNLFEVQTHSPITVISSAPSWGAKVSLGALQRKNCERCFSTGAEGFFGTSLLLEEKSHLTFTAGAYLTAQAITQKSIASSDMPWSFLGAGPKAHLRLHLADRFFLMASSYSYYDTTPKNPYITTHELGAQYNWHIDQGLRLVGTEKNAQRSLHCELYYYY